MMTKGPSRYCPKFCREAANRLPAWQYRLVPQMNRTGSCSIEITIHPGESFAIGNLAGGREMRGWQAAVQMPCEEQPAVVGIEVGKTALGRHASNSGVSGYKISRHQVQQFDRNCGARTRACRVATLGDTVFKRSHECRPQTCTTPVLVSGQAEASRTSVAGCTQECVRHKHYQIQKAARA